METYLTYNECMLKYDIHDIASLHEGETVYIECECLSKKIFRAKINCVIGKFIQFTPLDDMNNSSYSIGDVIGMCAKNIFIYSYF